MCLQACADKLDRELALYGTPPVFPAEVAPEVVSTPYPGSSHKSPDPGFPSTVTILQ